MDQPVWMAEAWQRLGTREVPGASNSRAILDFFRDAGRSDITRDEVPWCAAFVGACLERSDRPATGSLLARSYLGWGEVLDHPRLGAVAVLSRGSDPGAGHVGFWIGETDDELVLIGGNQTDAVTVDTFAKDRLLGLRWPRADTPEAPSIPVVATPEAGAAVNQPSDPDRGFADALAHVLEMEGGFTDDPDDPGGPTNKGVILEVFCRHTGRTLNGFTRARRISELREISDTMVEGIYRQRYWTPSMAASMPAPVALMHFDASVNHGLMGAARLLQQALRRQQETIDIDGEIGPLTLHAVGVADPARLITDYAAARRTRYRALPHFWKFGRGWLNRVGRTETRAHALVGRANEATTHEPTKGKDMTPNDATAYETAARTSKWWGSSMTIWGAAITALSTVVPILGPALGLDVTPDVVRQAGEQFVAVIQAIGGLIGTVMTIYGRTRATQLLERRQVQVNI